MGACGEWVVAFGGNQPITLTSNRTYSKSRWWRHQKASLCLDMYFLYPSIQFTFQTSSFDTQNKISIDTEPNMVVARKDTIPEDLRDIDPAPYAC